MHESAGPCNEKLWHKVDFSLLRKKLMLFSIVFNLSCCLLIENIFSPINKTFCSFITLRCNNGVDNHGVILSCFRQY